MTSLSNKEKLLLKDHDGIVLLRGETSYGDVYYAYIKADRKSIEKMERDYDQGKIVDFFNYGEVIEFGKGYEPPKEVQDRIRRKYGTRPDGSEW